MEGKWEKQHLKVVGRERVCVYVCQQTNTPTHPHPAFADCARGRLLSTAFACRALSTAMNGCMAAHATAAEHDRAREDWFAQRMVRAREREVKQRRKMEQEKFMRDWWGLPEQDPERVRREEEKLARPEKVGGARRQQQQQQQQPGADGPEGKR